MSDLDGFFIHTCQVETLQPQNNLGADVYSPAVPVAGWLEESNTIVRDRDGAEVVSSSRFHVPLTAAAAFTPGTRVTSPSGISSTVITVSRFDSGPLGLPDHALIALT